MRKSTVCLGNTPRIEPALLRQLAAVPGHVAGKAVLADAVILTEVPAPSESALDDIDTPDALAALRARDCHGPDSCTVR